MCRAVLAAYLVYLSHLTLFSLCNYYKNKIFINSHSLTCFFSDEKLLIATVFYFMGRVCYGPSVLWAEFVMGRTLNFLWAEVDKARNFHGIHGITENSDKYGSVRGIVNKTRNF